MRQCPECKFKTEEKFKCCPECGEALVEEATEIVAYLHETSGTGELMDEHHIPEKQADALRSLLYEVALVVKFTAEGAEIVGLQKPRKVAYSK